MLSIPGQKHTSCHALQEFFKPESLGSYVHRLQRLLAPGQVQFDAVAGGAWIYNVDHVMGPTSQPLAWYG